jgi:hypothetical protein
MISKMTAYLVNNTILQHQQFSLQNFNHANALSSEEEPSLSPEDILKLVPTLTKMKDGADVLTDEAALQHLFSDVSRENLVDVQEKYRKEEGDIDEKFLSKFAVDDGKPSADGDDIDMDLEMDQDLIDAVVPREFANYSIPQMEDEDFPDPMLAKFMPDTAHEKFRYDKKVKVFRFQQSSRAFQTC